MSSEIFEKGDLKLILSEVGTMATLSWTGSSDNRDPSIFLSPLLTNLTQQFKGKTVTLDFRKLDYMNSATVAPLLAFIKGLDGHGIPTVLIYNTELSWQRVNFQSMKTIARTLKQVEVRG